jgi:hypothetical protein
VEVARQRQLSELEEQGLIQAFEFTHELSWLLLKDFLADQGVSGISERLQGCGAGGPPTGTPTPSGAAMNRTSAVSAGVTTAPLLIPGLCEEDSQAILDVLTQHPKLETVVL